MMFAFPCLQTIEAEAVPIWDDGEFEKCTKQQANGLAQWETINDMILAFLAKKYFGKK